MPDPWLSADDIAAHLGVTKDTVYAWIAEKGMPAHKVGRLWKFQASEVDEWVRSGSAASPGETRPRCLVTGRNLSVAVDSLNDFAEPERGSHE